jgi:hypothetical protein
VPSALGAGIAGIVGAADHQRDIERAGARRRIHQGVQGVMARLGGDRDEAVRIGREPGLGQLLHPARQGGNVGNAGAPRDRPEPAQAGDQVADHAAPRMRLGERLDARASRSSA